MATVLNQKREDSGEELVKNSNPQKRINAQKQIKKKTAITLEKVFIMSPLN